jgi:hypothetical protein
MGDIADYMVDQMIDSGAYFRPWSRPLKVTCKHCEKKGLEWSPTNGRKWFLIEANGDPHRCQPTADLFKDLTK